MVRWHIDQVFPLEVLGLDDFRGVLLKDDLVVWIASPVNGVHSVGYLAHDPISLLEHAFGIPQSLRLVDLVGPPHQDLVSHLDLLQGHIVCLLYPTGLKLSGLLNDSWINSLGDLDLLLMLDAQAPGNSVIASHPAVLSLHLRNGLQVHHLDLLPRPHLIDNSRFKPLTSFNGHSRGLVNALLLKLLLILLLLIDYDLVDGNAIEVLDILPTAESLEEENGSIESLSLGYVKGRLSIPVPVVLVGFALLVEEQG